jgi:hypothetical protein
MNEQHEPVHLVKTSQFMIFVYRRVVPLLSLMKGPFNMINYFKAIEILDSTNTVPSYALKSVRFKN